MPSLVVSRPLFDASASAAAPWGAIEAGAQVQFAESLEASRGVRLDLGVSVLTQLNATFEKYVAADLQASGQAQAAITGQIQVPMNLFDEAGLAVRLQAIAQAAVGVQLRLGLNIGDFLALVDSDPRMAGLPARLFRIFLESIDIGGGLYAKAAVSAMAYANLVIAGKLIATGPTGAGFTISAEAGAGLKAGAGFRVFANMGIREPRRMVARSIDAVVDETIAGITRLVPQSDTATRVLLEAAQAPLKIGLRNAYELGELIATGQAPQDAVGAERMALRCVQVILEESQKFILQQLADISLRALQARLAALPIDAARWQSAQVSRTRLAETLGQLPTEPFQPTPENLAFWKRMIEDSVAVALDLGGGSLGAELQRDLAIFWASTQLVFMATQQISEAGAAVQVIGLPPRQVSRSFPQPLPTPTPPAMIFNVINTTLNRAVNTNLAAADLVNFLIAPATLDPLLPASPSLAAFLEVFRNTLGNSTGAVAQTLLENIGALDLDGTGANPTRTLTAMARALRAFLQQQLEVQLTATIRPLLGNNEDLRLYFDEVGMPALRLTANLVFDTAVNWHQQPLTPKAMTEALSSVLMMVLGRSLVVSLDVLLASGQQALKDELLQIAAIVEEDLNDPRNVVPTLAAVTSFSRSELAELTSETLRIAADVFGPMPDELRAKIRALLYDIVETLPPGEPATLANQLADAFFIPNFDLVRELAIEMAEYAGSSFADFVQRLLMRLAEMVLEELLEVINAADEQVRAWIGDLEAATRLLQQRIEELAREIAEIVVGAQQQFDEAIGSLLDLLENLSGQGARDRLRSGLVDVAVQKALGVLRDVPGYSGLPGDLRRAARSALRSVVRGLVNNLLRDPVLDGIAAIAADVDNIIEDVRALDPSRNLTTQLEDLLLDRVEDAVRAAFGGSNPRMSLSVTVGVSPFRTTLELGHVSIPLSQVVGAVRSVVGEIGAVEDALRAIAERLADAFATEAAVVEREHERDEVANEHGEVARQVAESAPGDLDIDVIEPVPGGAYAADIGVKIHVAGAPLSFAGRGANEQARILVFLNQAPIDLTRFAIAEVNGGLTADAPLTPSAIGSPMRGGVTVSRPLRGGVADRQMSPTVGLRLDTNQQLGAWGGRSGIGEVRTRQALSQIGLAAHWSTRAVTQKRAHRAGVRVVRAGTTAGARGANSVEHTRSLLGGAGRVKNGVAIPPAGRLFAGATQIGRTLRPTEAAVLGSQLQGGLLFTLQLPLGELREGANSLVASVVDGRGQKVSDAVAFFAFDGDHVAKPQPPRQPPGRRLSPGGGLALRPPVFLPRANDVAPAKPAKAETPGLMPPKQHRREAVKASRRFVAASSPQQPRVLALERVSQLKAARRFEPPPRRTKDTIKQAPDTTARQRSRADDGVKRGEDHA